MSALRKSGKRFFPVSPQQRECGTFPLLFFLEMIHISLKEGWFICRGRDIVSLWIVYLFIYFLKYLYTWECIYGLFRNLPQIIFLTKPSVESQSKLDYYPPNYTIITLMYSDLHIPALQTVGMSHCSLSS